MSMVRKFQRWWRDRRRRRAAKAGSAESREFVYLDEISVYSLLASRIGPIATEFTDSETATLQAEVSSSVSAGPSALAKAGASSRLEATQARSSQVLRKAIVQTTFKELYEYEREHLGIRPRVAGDGRCPSPTALNHEERGVLPWLINPAALRRGALIEVEAELSAERLFQMSTVITALVEIMRESDEIARAAEAVGQLDEIAAFANVIDQLLVGLIPIRGRVVDHCVVVWKDREWIVHRDLASQLEGEPIDLFVVGVAENALFWKDIRRVLFSDSPYRVLGRLGRSGIQSTWTPVKLIDVLKDVLPDLARQLEDLADVFIDVGHEGEASPSSGVGAGFSEALTVYARELTSASGQTLADPDVSRIVSAVLVMHEAPTTITERMKLLRELRDQLAAEFGVVVEPELAARLREPLLLGDIQPAPVQRAMTRPAADERFLDAEFIAMYW